jgi:hypothetical protein
MNKAIPEGGRSVKCARCGHQWRITPEEPEELTEALDDDFQDHAPGAGQEHHAPAAEAAPMRHGAAEAASQTIGDAWDVRPDHLAAAIQPEARSESAPQAPETIGDAWDVRRGHLAAAIASMGVSPDHTADEAEADADADRHAALARQPWQNQEIASEDFGGETGADESFADELEARGRAAQQASPFAGEAASSWPASSSWMTNAAASDARAGDGDPENSVRQALKAAMEDPEESGASGFGPGGGHSAVSRPVFAESASFEDAMASVAADDPSETEAEPGLLRFAPSPDGDPAEDSPASLSRDRAPIASLFAPAEGDEKAVDGENSEKFENDIVGIFRQQMQEKRSFGPASPRKGNGDGFTDYDREFSGNSEQSDDRYMADSPLDADAAALQAALEGSLRERHAAGESGGGGLALAAAWAVFLSVLTGVTLAFVSFRDEMVAALPGTAGLYRTIGFDVQEHPIDFGPVTYRWTVAEGKPMIEVTGRIINLTDREIAVPRVLVNVHDKANIDTVKATATIRTEPLGAGETADFTLEFLSPPKSISQIELAFAELD